MLVCTLLIISFEKAGRRNTVTEMRKKIYILMLLLPLMIQNVLVLTKRSNKPASTMSSETFAQLRSMSLHLPDPVRADRAMHALLCSNIKLSRRVLTRNVLKSIMKLKMKALQKMILPQPRLSPSSTMERHLFPRLLATSSV